MLPKDGRLFYGRLLDVDPTETGHITKTHVLWEISEDVALISTLVIVDCLIFMVHERGDLTCLSAKTGTVI